MKRYSYDVETNDCFSFDKEVVYEGKFKLSPEGAFQTQFRINEIVVGCAFSSGFSNNCLVLYSDGKKTIQIVVGYTKNDGYYLIPVCDDDLTQLKRRFLTCVCGNIVKTDGLADFCVRLNTPRVYVCPLVDELQSLGALVSNLRIMPCRMVMAWDNDDEIDAEFQEYDKVLDGDAFGRMATLVSNGMDVVNEVKRSVGVSPFYGRVLHGQWKNGSTLIVRMAEVDKFFPHVPVVLKNYVATSVPVKVEVSDLLRGEIGYNERQANLFVTTDYIPDTSIFMRFYKSFSGKGYVFSSDKTGITNKVLPVFRSNKAYRVIQ